MDLQLVFGQMYAVHGRFLWWNCETADNHENDRRENGWESGKKQDTIGVVSCGCVL